MTLLKHMKASLRERSLKNVRVQKSGCLDHCEFGPMCVVYPQGTWYRLIDDEDVEKVLNHLETHEPQSGAFVRLTDS